MSRKPNTLAIDNMLYKCLFCKERLLSLPLLDNHLKFQLCKEMKDWIKSNSYLARLHVMAYPSTFPKRSNYQVVKKPIKPLKIVLYNRETLEARRSAKSSSDAVNGFAGKQAGCSKPPNVTDGNILENIVNNGKGLKRKGFLLDLNENPM